jgi:hypothetical protein
MLMPLQDPDSVLIVLFKHAAIPNEAASVKAGRLVADDMEVCEVRFPGSRAVSVFPAHAFCPLKVFDPLTGRERSITYAERFAPQYKQFSAHTAQTRTGTPLDYAPFLTEARRAELKSQNIYTVEALAHIDGQELKNLGPGARELKNAAESFIERAAAGAVPIQMEAEMAAMRARNQVLEDDILALKRKAAENPSGARDFSAMSAEQLRAYITERTGHAPHGSLGVKVLQRMAADATTVAAENAA